MAQHTITAVFDGRAQADQAVEQLRSSGIPASDITTLPAAGETGTYATEEEGRTRGFWGSLEQLFGGTDDRATYAEGIRRGGFVVSVRVDDDRLDHVVDTLERHGSVDLDEREATWRGEGWTGGALAAGGVAAGTVAGSTVASRTATAVPPMASTLSDFGEPAPTVARAATPPATAGIATAARGGGDDVLQVVEERLDVGKRAVSRGKVRVHTSVVSREAAADITLHDEVVRVDRRSVDRPTSAAALDIDPFQERTIELEEFTEEAVVGKTAHVVEEIGIRREGSDRVETVRDTVRSTRVDIDDGRSGPAGTRLVEEIRDDMEVVGSDGVHVGMVDHLDGSRIKLKKDDGASGGEHHFLSRDAVQSVADKVVLAMTGAEARARWTAA